MKKLEKGNLGGLKGGKERGKLMQLYLIITVFFKKERKKIEHYKIITLFESSTVTEIQQ